MADLDNSPSNYETNAGKGICRLRTRFSDFDTGRLSWPQWNNDEHHTRTPWYQAWS